MLSEIDAAERRVRLEPESLPAALRRAVLARRRSPEAAPVPIERLSAIAVELGSEDKATRRDAARALAILGPRARPLERRIRSAWLQECNGRIRRILRKALRATRPSSGAFRKASLRVQLTPLLEARSPQQRRRDLEALAVLGLSPEAYGPVYQLARGEPEAFAAWAERWIADPRGLERRAQYRRSWVLAAIGRLAPTSLLYARELWAKTSTEARLARAVCASPVGELVEVVNTGFRMEIRRAYHSDPAVPTSYLGSIEIHNDGEGLSGSVTLLYNVRSGRYSFREKSLAADLKAIAARLL